MAITEDPSSAQESDIDLTTRSEATAAVARMRAAFGSGLTRPIEWRVEQLEALVRMLRQEEKRFSEALASDVGKPTLEGYTSDIAVTATEIELLAKNTPKWSKPRRVSLPLNSKPGRGYIQPEPLGVALVIAPWNYPIQLLLEPVAAALAAGNSVVAKPSELAPATSAALAELIPRYCDPEGIVVVEGDVAASTALLEERFDHIFFTGSTNVGRIVYQAAAKHLTPVTLELGGKSPVIIHDSANIKVAGRRIAWGKWLNAGQTCVAPDYVLVSEKNRDSLVDAIDSALTEFSGGDIRGSADYGRIVTERHAQRLSDLLTDHGGVVAVGGETDAAERYVEPTVVVDPSLDSRLMTEEIFGPILPVITIDSPSAAVDFINEREKPLALYIFADDSAAADDLVSRTTAGGTCVNHVIQQLLPPDMPFGGVGSSGIGRYHGRAGFDAFSNLRAVLRKKSTPDPKLLYPPYTKFKERLIRKFV